MKKQHDNMEETVRMCLVILRAAKPTSDPAKSIQEVGEALVKMGKALEGRSPAEALKIVRAAAILSGIEV